MKMLEARQYPLLFTFHCSLVKEVKVLVQGQALTVPFFSK
jgi:hypothetical protein